MDKRFFAALSALMLLTGCGRTDTASSGKDNSAASTAETTSFGEIESSVEETSLSEASSETTESPQTTESKRENLSFDEAKAELGLSDTELEDMVRRSLVMCFDRSQTEEPSDEEIKKYYSETIYGRFECIKADPRKFTYSVDGGEAFINDTLGLVPEKERKLAGRSGNTVSAELGFISARAENDHVYIRFNDDEDNTARILLFGSQYEMPGHKKFGLDKEYELTGVYSRYTDIFISTMGNLYLPVMFLITEDGCLEYVDICRCVDYGQLCPTPIPGNFKGCELLHPGSLVGGDEAYVYAKVKNGEYVDLSRWVNAVHYSLPEGFCSVVTDEHEIEGGSYCDIANITLDEYGSFESNTTALDSVISEGFGTFKNIGMNDNGLLFGYSYFENNSIDPIFGVVANDGPEGINFREIKS